MAHNYTITFRSLRSATTDAPYVVTIGGGTESTIALKPAASPFVTEEGDDEDVFCPVRTQTGYIRIVDDGLDANGNAFDWKDLIPLTDTARPVTLTQGGTVLWQGFMQSQNFGSALYGNPQEREYPIQCPLASAAGQDIVLATQPVTEMKNFAYYLKSILDYIVSMSNGAISFDYVYLQGGTTMQNNMLCLIDPQCFVELDKDENTISAKYNKYDVLEDICRYWGLTARVHGRSVYLCAPNDTSTFIKMSMANLATMAGGTAAGTSVNVQSVTIGNVFASMDNDVTLQRGYSKATVKGDAGNADKEIIKCYPQYIIDHMTDAQSGDTWDAGGDKAFWYKKKATSIDGIDMTGTANGTSLFATGWIVDSFPFDFDSNTTNIVQCNGIYNGSVKVRIATKFEHNFQGLYFTLNAETIFAGYKMDFTSGDNEYGDKKMYVRIGIETTRGGTTTRKYFTGAGLTGWSTTQTAIQVTLGNKGKTLYYLNSMYGSGSYEKNIPVPFGAGYFGKLFVEFLGTVDPIATLLVYDFALTDFTIDMANHGDLLLLPSNQDKTTYEFTAENDSACVEEWNADCIFCSFGPVKFGYGIYFADDGSSRPTSLHNRQENILAYRVGGASTGYWRQAKLMYRTELLANDQYVAALTPQYEATIDGVGCYPVSIGRDWRDDVAKVIFIQK